MSNHSGSYMLNEIVHGLVDMGVLNIMSAAQTKMLRKLLRRVRGEYDCNWSEIMDAELAKLLKTCARCADESEEVSADYGICAACQGSRWHWPQIYRPAQVLQQRTSAHKIAAVVDVIAGFDFDELEMLYAMLKRILAKWRDGSH